MRKKKSKWKLFLLGLKYFRIKFFWYSLPDDDKVPFGVLKRLLIPHTCKFTGETFLVKGHAFDRCIHWGCNMVYPNETLSLWDVQIMHCDQMIEFFTKYREFSHHIPKWQSFKASYIEFKLRDEKNKSQAYEIQKFQIPGY
jgi:hypothetical protein